MPFKISGGGVTEVLGIICVLEGVGVGTASKTESIIIIIPYYKKKIVIIERSAVYDMVRIRGTSSFESFGFFGFLRFQYYCCSTF